MLKISGLIFIIFSLTNIVYSDELSNTCSRKAEFKNKEVLVDGITGIKGSGLTKIMKNDPIALGHLKKYQDSEKVKLFNLISGSVSTSAIALGILYTGDKTNRNNFLLFGGVVALINFLTTKTVDYYNERELTLAIEAFNKNSSHPIRLIQQNESKKNTQSLFINKSWSF